MTVAELRGHLDLHLGPGGLPAVLAHARARECELQREACATANPGTRMVIELELLRQGEAVAVLEALADDGARFRVPAAGQRVLP